MVGRFFTELFARINSVRMVELRFRAINVRLEIGLTDNDGVDGVIMLSLLATYTGSKKLRQRSSEEIGSTSKTVGLCYFTTVVVVS